MKQEFDLTLPKSIVLIGMMGVGKTSIGRRLSQRLGVIFADSDQEVEKASMCSISDLFEIYGETVFHDVERRVIKRMLNEAPHVIATGGSAFVNPETHALIKRDGISIWLKADLETLLPRIERRDHRPQFSTGDTRQVLQQLIDEYQPMYKKADITIDCTQKTPEETVAKIILELNRYTSKLQVKSGQKIQHV